MGSHINLDLTELILIYITEITDPEEIINFTYMPEFYNQITSNNRITWQGNLITDEYCILTNACQECQSVAVGTGIYNNTYNVNIVIVVPKGGRPPFIPPGLPIGSSAGYFPWYISLLWNNR
jgi:hypothetical protein